LLDLAGGSGDDLLLLLELVLFLAEEAEGVDVALLFLGDGGLVSAEDARLFLLVVFFFVALLFLVGGERLVDDVMLIGESGGVPASGGVFRVEAAGVDAAGALLVLVALLVAALVAVVAVAAAAEPPEVAGAMAHTTKKVGGGVGCGGECVFSKTESTTKARRIFRRKMSMYWRAWDSTQNWSQMQMTEPKITHPTTLVGKLCRIGTYEWKLPILQSHNVKHSFKHTP
jgi:hypothetical protein